MVEQLDSVLRSIGFVEVNESNSDVTSWIIIRSLIVSSLALTHLVRVQRPSQKYTETTEGAIEKDGVAQEYKFFTPSNKNDHNDESEEDRKFRNHRKLNVQIADECIIMKDFVRLSANARISALICWLRDMMDGLLAEKVKNPMVDISSRT